MIFPLSIARCLFPIAFCLLPFAFCLLPVACCLKYSYFVYLCTVKEQRGCSVVAARKTSDLDSAYLQCAGVGSIPIIRSTHGHSVTVAHRFSGPECRIPTRQRWFDSACPCKQTTIY